MPFSDYSCAMVYSWISEEVMAKENNTQFPFSGRWLDESNEEAPFSSLSCPATACVLAWV